MKKKGFNNYEVRDNITAIIIINRKGEKFETLIDTEDLDKLIKLNYSFSVKWDRVLKSYYVKTCLYLGRENGKFKYKNIPLHDIIMDWHKGEVIEVIDHKNHNTLDNRKENLIKRTQQINTYNRKGANSNNTSGYRNVSKVGKWWYIQMQIKGKNTVIKKFPLDQLDEAGAYAEAMRIKYYNPILENNYIG